MKSEELLVRVVFLEGVRVVPFLRRECVQRFPFCPNPACALHTQAPQGTSWYSPVGYHLTKAFGHVPRFRCKVCGRTFSTQTFCVDYYAKKRIGYDDLLKRFESSGSLRGMARCLNVSCGTVQNRLERLSRQALALHASLRPTAHDEEKVCIDGFVSFEVSQYFPSEITISLTQDSRFVLDFSHATRRRAGTLTHAQKARARTLYPRVHFERGALTRTFSDILASLESERPPRPSHPLILVTDEKKEYSQALASWPLWHAQDEHHRIAHISVNSKLPRTKDNPLFASNYLDRELRKDQANHRRETVCFSRNVASGMARLALYLVCHNYRKRYLIKAPVSDHRSHAEVAGIDRASVEQGLTTMFGLRAFLSRIRLPPTLDRIWRRAYPTPLKKNKEYLPAFALA